MKKCIVGAIIVLATVGCSRKSDNSSVSFSLPQRVSPSGKLVQQGLSASAADDPVLGHVVLNISGPNMATIVRNYDKQSSGGIPSAISIDVPKGDNRLIQVLAVYQDPLNQSMSFFYGDVLKSLSNASESADILVTSMGGSASPVSGNVFGRYFNSPTDGPTADVATMFNPGAGKPRMIVERTTMFNGWFSLFALSSVPLEYEIQPALGAGVPELMWGGPVTLNSPALTPSTMTQNYRMRMVSPVSIRAQSNGGSTGYQVEEPRYSVWGYWKNKANLAPDPLTNLNVCRETAGLFGTQLTKIKQFDLTNLNWPTQPGLNGSLVTIGSTMPTDIQLSNVNSPISQYYYQGGNPSSCGSPSDRYTLYLKVTRDMVDGNGNDNAGGFRAPFIVDSMGSAMTVSAPGLPRVLTGQLLPGVAGNIDEVRVYKKTGVGNDDEQDNRECGDLLSANSGYVFAGSAMVSNMNVSVTTNITDSDVTNGTAAVVCSAKGGKVFASGLKLGTWAFSLSGGGGGSGPPAKLGVRANMVGAPANCKMVQIELQDSSNNPVTGGSNSSSVVVSLVAAGVTFYDSTCMTPISSATIGAGTSSVSIGMSASTSAYYPYSFSATGLTSATGNYVVAPGGAVTSLDFSNSSGNAINALPNGSCIPFRINSFDNFRNPTNAFASSTVNLVTEPGLNYYSDAACTTSVSTLTLTAGANQVSGYVKAATSGSALLNATIAAYDPNGSFTPYPLSAMQMLPVGGAGTPVYFGISGGPGFNYNTCYPLTVVSNDALGNTANMPAAATGISIYSQSGGSFFSSAGNCSAGISNLGSSTTVNIGASTANSDPIYFKAPSGGGSVRIDMMYSSGAGGSEMRGYGNFTLSP